MSTWEERFPEAAEYSKRDKMGLPYLQILFNNEGRVWGERVHHDRMNKDEIQRIVDKVMYDYGHVTTWEYVVRYLYDMTWEYARCKTLERAIEIIAEKAQDK